MPAIPVSLFGAKTATPIRDDHNRMISPGKRRHRIGLIYEDKQAEIALMSKKLYKKPPKPTCFEKIFGKRHVVLHVQVDIKGRSREGYIKVYKKSLKERFPLENEALKAQIRTSSNRDVTAYIHSLIKPKTREPSKKEDSLSSSVSSHEEIEYAEGKYIDTAITESEKAYQALRFELHCLRTVSTLFNLVSEEETEQHYADALKFINLISKDDINAMHRAQYEEYTNVTTPLIVALQCVGDPKKRLAIVQLLLEKGADPRLEGLKEGKKQSPIELAKSTNDPDLIKVFAIIESNLP